MTTGPGSGSNESEKCKIVRTLNLLRKNINELIDLVIFSTISHLFSFILFSLKLFVGQWNSD